MNKQLTDYIKVYRNIIPDEVCISMVTELEGSILSPHKFYSHIADTRTSHGNDPEFGMINSDTNNLIMKAAWEAINNYIVKDLQFPWFCSWGGFSPAKYIRYSTGNSMTKHCDHTHDIFTDTRGVPVVSIIGVLNNDFLGGDLALLDGITYDLKQGDIIVFPSNFLFPHELREVTSGKRYSFASFVW
jgi:hypothetical protein